MIGSNVVLLGRVRQKIEQGVIGQDGGGRIRTGRMSFLWDMNEFVLVFDKSELAGGFESDGVRAEFHSSLEEGQKADTIDGTRIGKFKVEQIKDSWQVITGYRREISDCARLNFGRPLQKARDANPSFEEVSLPAAKRAGGTRSPAGASFRTVVGAEPEHSIVGGTEPAQFLAQATDLLIHGSDAAIIVLLVFAALRIKSGVGRPGHHRQVRGVKPNDGEERAIRPDGFLDKRNNAIHDDGSTKPSGAYGRWEGNLI
jgi:hypothetical protein